MDLVPYVGARRPGAVSPNQGGGTTQLGSQIHPRQGSVVTCLVRTLQAFKSKIKMLNVVALFASKCPLILHASRTPCLATSLLFGGLGCFGLAKKDHLSGL